MSRCLPIRMLAVVGILFLVATLLVACGTTAAPTPAPKAADTGAAPAKAKEAAPAAAPAAPKPPVKIGGIFDLTGGTADVGVPYADGVKDCVAYINEKGGIDGRKIELIGIDYAYKIPQAEEAYNKLTTQDKVAVILGWGTGDTEAMAPKINKDKIPFMSASYSEHLVKNVETNPYNFMIGVTYSDQTRIVLKWIKDNYKGSGNPKVAFIYNDSGFGKSPIQDGKDWAAKHGIDIVDEEIVALTALEAKSQLLNMQKTGAEYAIIQQTANATATILKDAKTLGLKTQFVGLNWAADEKTIDLAGAAAENYVGAIPFAFIDENVPGLQEIKDFAKAKGKDWTKFNIRYIQGWATLKVMAEGIRRSGDNLTGEGIKAALQTLTNYDTGGMLAPITFSPKSNKGATKMKIYQVKSGKWVPITDFLQATE